MRATCSAHAHRIHTPNSSNILLSYTSYQYHGIKRTSLADCVYDGVLFPLPLLTCDMLLHRVNYLLHISIAIFLVFFSCKFRNKHVQRKPKENLVKNIHLKNLLQLQRQETVLVRGMLLYARRKWSIWISITKNGLLSTCDNF